MKTTFCSAVFATIFLAASVFAMPKAQAGTCETLDSGSARPQYMLDRMPACGGTQPTSAGTSGQTAAGALTTLFAADNGGSDTGGVYFDLQAIGPDNVTVTSWDTNLDSSFVGDVSIWYRTGTYAGSESSSSGWNLVGTATGVTSAGSDMPTTLNVPPLVIPAGSTYGIAITLTPGGGSVGNGHNYTNGTGSNQVYSDGTLQISAGSANNVAFSGSTFTPRVWNGTVHYNAQAPFTFTPVPAVGRFGLAIMVLLLLGCAMTLLSRRNRSKARARV